MVKLILDFCAPCMLVSLLLLLGGCGPADYPSSKSFDINDSGASAGIEPASSQADSLAESSVSEAELAEVDVHGAEALAAVSQRKIIYDTSIGLVVEDYRNFESQLPGLVTAHGGFISNSDTERRYNDRQSGTWVVRVPVDSYAAFLNGVDTLGFAETRQENAQDVTEEYVDIEARIKNKRSLEARILALLEERTGKLADVLEIERELSRVREEMERMEGRLRFLKNRTSLATVTIHCREQKAYQPTAAPTLVSRIGTAWEGSLHALKNIGENLLVAFIASAPWIVVIGIPVYVFWKLLRRQRR